MKASPIRLADDEAVERVAVKCGKRRKGENVAFIYPSGYDQLPGG